MIELDSNLFYKMIRILAETQDVYRFQIGESNNMMHMIAVDNSNVCCQEVTIFDGDIVSYTKDIEAGREIALNVKMMLPYAKACKKDGTIKMRFYHKPDNEGRVSSIELESTYGNIFTMDADDLDSTRRAPLPIKISYRKAPSKFSITHKQFKTMADNIGVKTSGKYESTILECLDTMIVMENKVSGAKTSIPYGSNFPNRSLFSWWYLRKVLKTSDSKDLMTFTLGTDTPIQVTNNSLPFFNVFTLAMRLESNHG